MTEYVLRYSAALREELSSPDHVSVTEEDRYTGLLNVGGLPIYRTKEQIGFQLKNVSQS